MHSPPKVPGHLPITSMPQMVDEAGHLGSHQERMEVDTPHPKSCHTCKWDSLVTQPPLIWPGLREGSTSLVYVSLWIWRLLYIKGVKSVEIHVSVGRFGLLCSVFSGFHQTLKGAVGLRRFSTHKVAHRY